MRLADLWGLIRLGIGSVTSKDGLADAISSTPGSGKKGQDQTARYYPWGFDSRSPTGGKRVFVGLGGGSQLAQVGERNDKAKPDYADEDWTTILHNEVEGTWVKLRKDGGVQVAGKGNLVELKADGSTKLTSKGGAAVELKADGTVSLNGGSSPANRQGDPVVAAAGMVTWMSQVATALNGIAPGSVAPPAPANFGTTSGGNPKVTT